MEKIDVLRASVIEAAQCDITNIRGVLQRPVFFLYSDSVLGAMHAVSIIEKIEQPVAVVGIGGSTLDQYSLPHWSVEDFLKKSRQYKDAILLDFSMSHFERAMAERLAAVSGVELLECPMVLAELDLHSVYESVRDYRSFTIDRLDDFLALGDRLADDWSRETLYANLLFRLTFNRGPLLQACADPSEEYFSTFTNSTTFRLGSREHYVDCGAYQGPIIEKFIAATQGRYSSISAFEPDRTNFDTLRRFESGVLPGIHLFNKAVSSRKQTLRFHETGTVSSHVSAEGNVVVETTRLDDELEKLTFLKMDVEGFEPHTLQGARGLLASQRPRIASCVYHYALDPLKVVEKIDHLVGGYHYRLRQHTGGYYYDLVLYASPEMGVEPMRSVV